MRRPSILNAKLSSIERQAWVVQKNLRRGGRQQTQRASLSVQAKKVGRPPPLITDRNAPVESLAVWQHAFHHRATTNRIHARRALHVDRRPCPLPPCAASSAAPSAPTPPLHPLASRPLPTTYTHSRKPSHQTSRRPFLASAVEMAKSREDIAVEILEAIYKKKDIDTDDLQHFAPNSQVCLCVCVCV